VVKIKPLTEMKEHLRAAADWIPGRYEEAIPRVVWKDPALAGQELYDRVMAKAEVRKRRAAKIAKMTDEDIRKPMREKGVPVIGDRIRLAIDKYGEHVAPHRDFIEALILEPKTDVIRENILKRVLPIAEGLHKKKLELMGA